MATKLYAAKFKRLKVPKVVFYKSVAGSKASFEEVTGQIAALEVQDLGGSPETPHELHRLDATGRLVWKTRHPSLIETLWHAEWEFGIAEDAWKTKLV